MSTSRRTVLAAGAGLATLDLALAADAQHDVAELARLSAQGNAALMRGDIDRYMALVPLAPEFTLMSPFGGEPGRASSYTPERLQSIGRFFRNGDLEQEVVHAWATSDMAMLAVIERARHVEVGGLPAQDWALRVTLVYRRQGKDWLLIHRHADPLAAGISLQQAALLGGADRQPPVPAR